MSPLEMLKSLQFVIGPHGRPSAVQIDIRTWDAMLDWIEDMEDRTLIREAVPRLRAGPKGSQALRWQDVKAEWEGK